MLIVDYALRDDTLDLIARLFWGFFVGWRTTANTYRLASILSVHPQMDTRTICNNGV